MRVALVGDFHGNGVAFDAIREDMEEVDRVFGLGDYLFPSAGSFRIVDWMRANEKDGIFVRGNHDEWNTSRRYRDSFRSDPTDLLRYVDSLPERQVVSLNGHRALLVHGYPVHSRFRASDDLRRPLRPEINLQLLRREYIERFVDVSDVDVMLWGDFHLPYVEVHDDIVLINPGAAGLSADQLLQHVSYMIVEFEPEQLTIEHRRLPISVNDVIADVGEEWTEGSAEESWLVTRLYGESRIQTRDWKTCWGRIEIPRGTDGYDRKGPLWNLVAEIPPPAW